MERPSKFAWVASLNRWFSRVVMSAASSPNDTGDQTGAINKLTHLHFVIDEKRKAFKTWNRKLYRLTKYSLIAIIVLGVISL